MHSPSWIYSQENKHNCAKVTRALSVFFSPGVVELLMWVLYTESRDTGPDCMTCKSLTFTPEAAINEDVSIIYTFIAVFLNTRL